MADGLRLSLARRSKRSDVSFLQTQGLKVTQLTCVAMSEAASVTTIFRKRSSTIRLAGHVFILSML
jgi:hypothetical protein